MKTDLLKRINNVISKSSYKKNKKEILKWLKDQKLAAYLINKLQKEKLNDLKSLDFILEEEIKKENIFPIFHILQENISEKNCQFILDFLFDKFPSAKEEKSLRIDDFIGGTVNILDIIIKQYPEKIESVYLLIKLILRVHQKHFRELRTPRSHDKQIIADLLQKIYFEYRKQKNIKRIDEIINLIDLGFDLVSDYSDMSMYTPSHIFEVLEDYISLDFKANFEKIFEIILVQFKSKGSWFDGWEGFGGGISQFGIKYHISDRHFVGKVLSPALEKFYSESKNKQETWKYIRECYVSRKSEEVSNRKPDFLTRSTIGIVLDRYKNCRGKNKEEAFEILRDFMKMGKGIPSKTDLIFQKLKETDFNLDKKWKFIEISLSLEWNKDKLPANIFVEQLVADFGKENYRPAIELQNKWLETREKRKKKVGFMDDYTVEAIKSLLQGEKTRKEGLKFFESYVSKDIFRNNLERFDVFDVAQILGGILESNFDFGLKILNEISSRKKMTENEQVLVCNSINKIDNKEILLKIYNNFLLPFLEKLDNNIVRIERRIDNSHVRGALVDFGDLLAKAGYFKEALFIAEIFIDDKDPIIENEEDDPRGEHNLHKRAQKGDDLNSITSVRGKVCWLLHEFPVLGGRKYIPKAVSLVKKLSKDNNYYVRKQATLPLAELVRVRNAVLPEDKTKWFLNREVSKEIEEIAFAMLRRKDNQKIKSIMVGLAHVFEYMRSLKEEGSIEMLSVFRNCKFDEAKKGMMSTFLFYAEFRKTAFKGELWKSLGSFDDSKTKKLLIDILRNGTANDRDNFAWQFNSLINESRTKDSTLAFEDAFKIAHKYLMIIAEIYEPQSYKDIYRFIKENIKERYDECFAFFKFCLAKEKAGLIAIEKNNKPIDRTWISYYHYDEILDKIMETDKRNDCIVALKTISSFPAGAFIYHGMSKTINYLKTFPNDNKEVEEIFNNLIEKEPNFYDDKQEWLNS